MGVTTCYYTDSDSIEPERTVSSDSFTEIEVSGTPTSFRISIDWDNEFSIISVSVNRAN